MDMKPGAPKFFFAAALVIGIPLIIIASLIFGPEVVFEWLWEQIR